MYASLNPLIFARAGAVFTLAPECSLQFSDFGAGGLRFAVTSPASQTHDGLPHGTVIALASKVNIEITLHLNGAGDKAAVWWNRWKKVNSILGDTVLHTDRTNIPLIECSDLSIATIPDLTFAPVSGSNIDFNVVLKGWTTANEGILAAVGG
jgi:hypothetical protein